MTPDLLVREKDVERVAGVREVGKFRFYLIRLAGVSVLKSGASKILSNRVVRTEMKSASLNA